MTPFAATLHASPEEVRKKMTFVRHTAGESGIFRYSLWVPAGFQCGPAVADGPHAAKLATFTPEVGAGAPSDTEVTVSVTLLARDVDPADFVENDLAARGAEIVDRRTAYGPPGWVSDLLSRTTKGGKPFLTRTTMAKDGAKLYRVDCTAPEAEFEQWAERFLLSLASFRVEDPSNRTIAESTETLRYVDPFVFSFKYPSSWTLVPEQLVEDATWVRLDNHVGDKCAGRLYVGLRSTKGPVDPQAELGELTRRIAGAGAQPTEVRDNDEALVEGFSRSVEVISQATLGDAAAPYATECRAQVHLNKKACVILGVYGPARESSADWWAVNKRAYELVRDSLSVVF